MKKHIFIWLCLLNLSVFAWWHGHNHAAPLPPLFVMVDAAPPPTPREYAREQRTAPRLPQVAKPVKGKPAKPAPARPSIFSVLARGE